MHILFCLFLKKSLISIKKRYLKQQSITIIVLYSSGIMRKTSENLNLLNAIQLQAIALKITEKHSFYNDDR